MTLHRTIGLRALYVWGAPLITDGGPGLLGTDPLVSTRLRMGGGGGASQGGGGGGHRPTHTPPRTGN